MKDLYEAILQGLTKVGGVGAIAIHLDDPRKITVFFRKGGRVSRVIFPIQEWTELHPIDRGIWIDRFLDHARQDVWDQMPGPGAAWGKER